MRWKCGFCRVSDKEVRYSMRTTPLPHQSWLDQLALCAKLSHVGACLQKATWQVTQWWTRLRWGRFFCRIGDMELEDLPLRCPYDSLPVRTHGSCGRIT